MSFPKERFVKNSTEGIAEGKCNESSEMIYSIYTYVHVYKELYKRRRWVLSKYMAYIKVPLYMYVGLVLSIERTTRSHGVTL